jgi:hypothetical protein
MDDLKIGEHPACRCRFDERDRKRSAAQGPKLPRADHITQNIPAGYFGEPYDIGHLHRWEIRALPLLGSYKRPKSTKLL